MATSPLNKTIDWKIKPTFLKSGFKFHEPYSQDIDRRIENIFAMTEETRFRDTITLYKNNKKPKTNAIEVSYVRKHNNLGRSFEAKGTICWTSMERKLRNSLIRGLVYDVDMVCCQPNILRQICENENWNCHKLIQLIETRKDFVRIVCDNYKVSNKIAKELISTIMFGGSLSSWKKDNNLPEDDFVEFNEGCEDLRREIIDISTKIKLENLPLFKVIKTLKEESGKVWNNELGSFLANYLQHQEFIVIDFAMDWLDKRGYFDMKLGKKDSKVGSYEFDGFKLWKEIVDKKGQHINDLVQELNQVILQQFGRHIQFAIKDLDEVLDDIDFDKPSEVKSTEEDKLPIYKEMKEDFELTHAKIVSKGLYITTAFGEVQILSRQSILNCYEHLQCVNNFVPQPFIKVWMTNDRHIRTYDDMEIIPPPLICPSNIYNLWKPFEISLHEIEGIETKEQQDQLDDNVDFLIKHLEYLCGNNEIVFDWFYSFICHMFQRPAEKPGVVPVFVSNQGAGKSTITYMISKLMGVSKVFETANPLETVFGKFTPNMENSLFVNIDELSKHDMKLAFNKLKNLVTAPRIYINKKNCPEYEVNSYHRYLFTTNSNDPLPTSKDDRRFVIIRCSDEKIGDREYFNKVYKLLEDKNTMRALYDSFMDEPNIQDLKNIPQTEFQDNLKESYEPPEIKWLRDEITMNGFANHMKSQELGKDYIVKETINNLYSSYSAFCKKMKLDFVDNVIKFSLKLNNSNITGLGKATNGKQYSYRMLNISEMVRYFEISIVEDNEEYPSMLEQNDCEHEP